jgi:hypothetical protein
MKRVLYAIASLLMAMSVNAICNTSLVFTEDNRINVIKPVVNESGWKIPGLEESQVADPRKLLPRTYGTASVPLHVTVLKPPREFITTIPLYRLKDGQALIVAEGGLAIAGCSVCITTIVT